MNTETATAAPEEGFGLTMGSTDQYGVRRDRMLLWKAQGYVDTDATSAEDILEKAGLNWDVVSTPLTVTDPQGNTVTDKKRFVICRDDTYAPLGVAKSRYVTSSNREVLAFTDAIFDSGQAKYEAAWEWRGGESVGVAMRLPDDVMVAGVDKHGLYILIKTSHDGGGSVTIAATPVRLACTNMVTIALKAATRVFRAAHTSSLEGRLAEARQTLDVTYSYSKAWEAEVEKLLNESVDEAKVSAVATDLFGEKNAKAAVELWLDVPNIAEYRDTRYGAFNAMTEFAQWVRPRDPQLESVMAGPIARQTDRAFQLLST